ncbi:hypothetical protein VU07_00445 [Desulfobulbus sp. F4]|nr:hypothetical protein [Desulfobulbus sp. F4]
MVYIIKIRGNKYTKKTFFIIIFSSIALLFAGIAPSVRNYINHSFFSPSDALSNNLLKCLAGPVMISKGREEEYEKIRRNIKQLKVKDRVAVQNKYSFYLYWQYPVETGKILFHHIIWNIFEPHWEHILNVYQTGFKLNSPLNDHGNIKKNIFLAVPFFIYYILTYLGVVLFLFMKNKGVFFFSIGLLIYSLPLAASIINGSGARMRIYIEPILLTTAYIGYMFFFKRKKMMRFFLANT